ncbi:inositol monophosphatase family protein [Mycobacterium syngnathidarum]|uniref:inositol-phosphate phosphatase n=1 Tax=Mycobacterium syngnathidarum TaxID=1908205 RepID=A0A1Q9WGD2_9MYCO|nr:inositol monophosphatase family protein [Mycobacterium syngnathidarum]OHT87157.1 inositol monophosphatase [Mycobacterium syngnathidarum]OLT97863.1 inositol monophosphatase [Mycobacterium syngnathidarum]
MVTDVDLSIQRHITTYLQQVTPDIDLLGEENAHRFNLATPEYLWVLDPIDGTSNFVHGLPLYAVSLALLHHGRPIIAVTRAPVLNRTYHAIADQGAYLNDQPIGASATTVLTEAIVTLGDYAVGDDSARRNHYRLALTSALVPRVERIRMLGTATLDLAMLAEGATDAAVIMANKPWDIAAGSLLAREAGAIVTDVHGHAHTHQSTSTIAAAPGIARELSTILDTLNTASPGHRDDTAR